MRLHYEERKLAERSPSVLKGEITVPVIDERESLEDWYEDNSVEELDMRAIQELYAILDYCDQHKLQNVVFVNFSHKIIRESQYVRMRRANRIAQLIEDRGYRMLNLEHETDAVSFDIMYDFYDREHLHHFGRTKLTDYLCEWLIEEYDLQPRPQTEENRSYWDDCARYVPVMDELIIERMDEGREDELYEDNRLLEELNRRLNEKVAM